MCSLCWQALVVSFCRLVSALLFRYGYLKAVLSISTSSVCCLFPVILLACCQHDVHGIKDSTLLFILTISAARCASIRLGPIGRLHFCSKNSTLPACIKKFSPEMSATLNFSSLSPLSSFGCFCWIHTSSLSSFHSFISSIMGIIWLSMAVDRTV
jgi:hypothetical protein